MNLDHNLFQVSKLSENEKKGLHQEWNTFFPQKTKKRSSPKISPLGSGDLRSYAHHSQIIGGDADEDHNQIIWGGFSQIFGGIYPPIPPGFRHPCL